MSEDNSVATVEKTANVEDAISGDVVSKIRAQFNEEKWTRMSAKDVTISRFKILDSILDEVSEKVLIDELESITKEHLEEYEPSLSARYLLGMLALKTGYPENLHYLKTLLDQFQSLSKWVVVDYLCDKMLEQNENRAVLRAKATALEKLGHTKEAVPVLEKLAQIDQRNPDIAFKYAEAIISEDIDQAIQFYKQAAEVYAKSLSFDKLKTVWGRLVDLIPEDFSFHRKIERTLMGNRQKDVLSELYVQLAHYYIKKGKIDLTIRICKKILECNSNYSRFKNELIRSYREKYKNHSLLEDFIKYSGLLDTRKNVIHSMQNFETNIVFDKDNYVHHRSWGVGKIKELNTQQTVIDFKDKINHKMNIEMALKSLKPLKENHFLVYQHEKPEELKILFESNLIEFFKLLLSSFGNQLSLTEIKFHLSDVYVPEKQWSKWWPKTRTAVLKDNLIGISPQKKNVLELRDSPIVRSEVFIEKFQVAQTFEDRVQIAVDALKESKDCIEALDYMQLTFKEGLKSLEVEKRLQSLWLLELFDDALGYEENVVTQEMIDFCSDSIKVTSTSKSVEIGLSLKSTDLLKKYTKLLREKHKDWEAIYLELLFNLPVRFHKSLISDLITGGDDALLTKFFTKLGKNVASHPELFLSVFRGLVLGQWDVRYLSPDQYLLSFFRLGKMLPKIEIKGTKQKGIFKELFCGSNKDDFFNFVIKHAELGSPRKLISLLKEINFMPDLEKSKFTEAFMKERPDEFSGVQETKSGISIEEMIRESEKKGSGIASQSAILRMKRKLEYLLNMEIPENSREIGIAQEKGDLRENAEYKAAMERQSILQSTVIRLENEIKAIIPIVGTIIPKGNITVGSRVKLNEQKSDDTFVYSIMDRWDADIDTGVIDYQSPLGKALLGHKVGDLVKFGSGGEERELKIIDINRAIDNEGLLI